MSKVGRPKSSIKKIQVTFQLPVHVHRKLLSYCDEHGTTQTWVFARSLDKYLKDKSNG